MAFFGIAETIDPLDPLRPALSCRSGRGQHDPVTPDNANERASIPCSTRYFMPLWLAGWFVFCSQIVFGCMLRYCSAA